MCDRVLQENGAFFTEVQVLLCYPAVRRRATAGSIRGCGSEQGRRPKNGRGLSSDYLELCSVGPITQWSAFENVVEIIVLRCMMYSMSVLVCFDESRVKAVYQHLDKKIHT